MSRCEHVTWLGISKPQEYIIHDENRMARILAEMMAPQVQKPSLLLFVGGRTKNVAIKELFPHNNAKRAKTGGMANLRMDTATLKSDHPILFADSNPTYQPGPEIPSPLCHEVRSFPFRASTISDAGLFNLLHSRFLCVFSDVICLFAEDLLGVDNAIELLKTWAGMIVAGANGFSEVRPRVVIVTTGDDASPTYNVLEAEDLRFNLRQQDLIQSFSSITVLRLANAQISSLSRYRRLKEVLLRHTDETRQFRQSRRCLFSASHLCHLVQRGIRHLADADVPMLDLVSLSRSQRALTQDYAEHLHHFIQLSERTTTRRDSLSWVASSILLDAYPPGMHGKPKSFTTWTI